MDIEVVVEKTTRDGVSMRLSEDTHRNLYTATVVEYVGLIKIVKDGSVIFVFDPDEKEEEGTITVDAGKFDWHTPIVPAVFVKDNSEYYEISLFKKS